MAAGTFTVAGQRVRTSSTRRYVAWTVAREGGKVIGIAKRSDSIERMRAEIRRAGVTSSRYFVVIDTATGEQVQGI